MSNLTNKHLQRMRELMGNKKPINESVSNSASLVKKSPNGKSYGIVRENTKYFIKESNDGVNFDFIGGLGNKTKNQYNSYEEATKHLNLMFEDFNRSFGVQEGTDILTSDIIEEKRFVIKSKKKPAADTGSFDFGDSNTGKAQQSSGDDFDFGGDDKGGESSGDDFDFGDLGGDDKGGEDLNLSGDENDPDLDLDANTEDDPIKSIQKMTGKLGQKIRDTEDLSSDTMKWVAKSIISALDLEAMDNEDKKDIIRAVKKKEDEGSDEEFDFMDDDNHGLSDDTLRELTDAHDEDDFTQDDDDMVDWNTLSPEERMGVIQNSQYPGDSEEPIMDWDEEVDETPDYLNDGPFTKGTSNQTMMFPPEEVYSNYMSDEDYMEDEEEMYGPSSGIDPDEKVLDDDLILPFYDDESDEYPGMESDWMEDTYDYHEVDDDEDYMSDYMEDRAEDLDHTDYMSKFNKDVKRGLSSGGRNLEIHELDSHLRKIKNKLGGSAHIDGNMVVGSFGFVKVTNKGYELHKEGSRYPQTFKFDELGKLKNALAGVDYMEDIEDTPRMMPQTAPSRPQTRPETPVKPGRPDTDKPSPSKRPFTPPPHITPGEEPAPKARDEYDYMGEEDSEICPACGGEGHKGSLGFNREPKMCTTCKGEGHITPQHMEDEGGYDVDGQYNPYSKPTSTIPNSGNMNINYGYREKFPFKIDYMGDNDELLDKRKSMRSPAPAPSKPQTRPDTPTKPGRPDTDKPSPSKRPFTPPPHITPGEEPAPKARGRNRF